MKHTILNELRLLLGRDVSLEAVKDANNMEIVYEAEKFEKDFSVGIQTPDGIVPVPVGEYQLEDGRIMIVEVEGIISEVKEAQPASEPEMETTETEAPKAEPAATKEPKRVVESISKETFFEAIELLRTEFEAKLEALKPVENEVELKGLEPNPEAVVKTAPKNGIEMFLNSIYK